MNDHLTYHTDSARRGLNHDFPFSPSGAWHKYLSISLPTRSAPPNTDPSKVHATVRGAVLLIKDWVFSTGPHTGEMHNLVIVATCDNQVYGFAEDQLLAGSQTWLWQTPLPVNWLLRLGSNMGPIGVCGTPVADPANGRVFVMAIHDDGTPSSPHGAFTIFSLDLNVGTILQQAQLLDPGAAGRPSFNGDAQDQRGGLNLVCGRVYACFAAFYAEDNPPPHPPYYGWVVACTANNLAEQLFLPMTNAFPAGAGIWGPGGAVAGPDGTVYVATGNGYFNWDSTAVDPYFANLPPGKHPGDIGDYFEGVVRVGVIYSGSTSPLTGSLAVLDWYQPADAQAQTKSDLDFGGSSPIVLPPINGQEIVAVCPKDGKVYLLNRLAMGGWGGQMFVHATRVFSGESKSAPAFLRTLAGDNILLVAGTGTPGLAAFRVTASSATSANLTQLWPTANQSITLGDDGGSPTIMANPGLNDAALVWIVDGTSVSDQLLNAQLRAFDALTGNLVYSSSTVSSDQLIETLPHFAPITCAGQSVFVGTYDGFVGYTQVPTKRIKELKPEKYEKIEKFEKIEYKELIKREFKENLKAEFDVKFIEWPPKLKDIEAGPGVGLGGDPYAVIGVLTARIDALEQRLAAGKAFIRPEERPKVGENIPQTKESKVEGEGELQKSKPAVPQPKKKGRRR